MCGFAIAPIMRAVIAVLAHLQLRVHARDDDVELGEQLVLLVERAVLEDVDLDAARGCAAARAPRSAGRRVELLAQPVGLEAVRDREPGRVVGHREVLVAELGRGAGHALRPASRRRTSPSACAGRRAARPAPRRPVRPARRVVRVELEPLEVAGHLAGERLGDHRPWCRRCPGAPAASGPGAVARARPSSVVATTSVALRNASTLYRGAAELEQERDPVQCLSGSTPARYPAIHGR